MRRYYEEDNDEQARARGKAPDSSDDEALDDLYARGFTLKLRLLLGGAAALCLIAVTLAVVLMGRAQTAKRLPADAQVLSNGGLAGGALENASKEDKALAMMKNQTTTAPNLGRNPLANPRYYLDPAARKPGADGIIHIPEAYFATQSNDIYINTQDYLGKTIQLEGMFKELKADGNVCRYVLRYGPGCCSYDNNCGFELSYDGSWPKVDDWVSATGVLEQYTQNGKQSIRLRLDKLTVMKNRGEEYVSR